jgi:yecA family protein
MLNMTTAVIDFDGLQEALEKLYAMTDASEAHGTLCGLLLGQQDFSRWIEYTLEQMPDENNLLAREKLQLLQDLYAQTRTNLNAEDMSLELLLPDESFEFDQRLDALGSWCRGFLYGLAVSGESLLKGLSEQGRECMNDLLQISQLDHDEEQSEESETEYIEIVEHVRLSVIYMNEEINPVLPAPLVQ